MSHSPGPWVVVEGTNNGWEVRGTLGQPIAIEPWHGGMEHKKYAELYRANATLIAAAPDLLEALQKLVSAWDANLPVAFGIELPDARAAIAKAVGK